MFTLVQIREAVAAGLSGIAWIVLEAAQRIDWQAVLSVTVHLLIAHLR